MTSDIFDQLRRCASAAKASEAKVARVVLADPQAAVAATVADLAAGAEVSQASVVRFARSLGFAGLPDLRIALAKELSRRATELELSSIAEGAIDARDSLADVVAKIAFHEARSIEQTARLVDLHTLEVVANAVADAQRVVLLGVGASGLVADDLSQKLQRIGLVCLFSPDTHVQLMHAALTGAGAVVIAFSFGGHTAEVRHGLDLARQSGATTVAVTNFPTSPVGGAAEHVLVASARETHFRAGAMASRMAQLAVVDFLFTRVGQLRFDDLEAALDATRTAVSWQHPGQ